MTGPALALALLIAAAPAAPKKAPPKAAAAAKTPLDKAVELYKKGSCRASREQLLPLVDSLTGAEQNNVRGFLAASYLCSRDEANARRQVELLLGAAPDFDGSTISPALNDFLAPVKKELAEKKAAEAEKAAKAAAAASAAQQPEPPKVRILRVAVVDPQLSVDAEVAKVVPAYVQALGAEIAKLEGIQVLGASDIREMLGFDRQRQLLGCSHDECLKDLGGALGVDEIISTQIASAGRSLTLSLKRLDMRKTRLVQNDTRTIEKSGGEEMLALLGVQVEALFPGKELKPGKARGVDKETLRRLIPPPLPRTVFFATGGAAILAAGAGGIFGLQMRDAQTQYNGLTSSSTPVAGSDLKKMENKASSSATIANAFFLGAGVLAVGAVVEAFLTDWDPAPKAEKPAAATLVPTRGGAALAVTGHF